jgi:hypothetical protein
MTFLQYTTPPSLDISTLEKDYLSNEEEAEHSYNPFRLENFQRYQPIYSKFFALTETNYNEVALNHKFHIRDMSTVLDLAENKTQTHPIFIKYSPLLDPLRYLIGKYSSSDKTIRVLPSLSSAGSHPKLTDSNNASYTDNFFSFLTSKLLNEHGMVNCIDYYGSYLGVQNKFKMNIADDLDYLMGSTYFIENKNKVYSMNTANEDEFANFGSRTNKQRLRISSSDIHNISITNLSVEEMDVSCDLEAEEIVYENNKDGTSASESESDSESSASDSGASEESSDSGSSDNEEGSCDNSDENKSGSNSGSEGSWETESEEDNVSSMSDSYSEDIKNVYIHDFPVQLICLEKCDGTLDELFVQYKLTCEQGIAALTQVIMTLLMLQKCFHFTHNDLHTNNIMYVNTDVEFLYYKYNRQVYKVPTYGRIFKLIDFGRSIYKFQGHTFCSDSFAPGGDAATQYNCEPYMNDNKPRIDPNYSFDLCRLGSSIYDFIIDEDMPAKSYDDLQKVIDYWCMDDADKNVLYKKNGDERYPGFKLYKMIARNVHRHTPEAQLEMPIFSEFLTNAPGEVVMDIDALPVYA